MSVREVIDLTKEESCCTCKHNPWCRLYSISASELAYVASKVAMAGRLDNDGFVKYNKWLVTPVTGMERLKKAERRYGSDIYAPGNTIWV